VCTSRSTYRDKENLSVITVRFRAPLHPVKRVPIKAEKIRFFQLKSLDLQFSISIYF
jgi:hypothetical protein